MDRNQIFVGVKEILVQTFKVDEEDVRMDSHLDDDLGLDSVDVMDSFFLVEEKFGIKLIEDNSPSNAPVKLETVEDLVLLIEGKSTVN